jgi:hypothetical protein
MRKWDDFSEISQNFVSQNFSQISQKFSENFRENEKYIKFDSDTACMVHVV